MDLFITDNQSSPIKLDILRQSTPVGTLVFNLSFAQKSLLQSIPQKTNSVGKNMFISTWIFDQCQVDFLKLNFNPRLPSDMNIDGCVCGMWRVKAFSHFRGLKFDCYLETTVPPGLLGSPEFGDSFIGRSWNNDKDKITIGTESEEYLSGKAYLQKGQQGLSFHYKNHAEFELIQYLNNGLRINLSELMENDFVQIHFVSAWTSTNNLLDATWHAVNQSADDILRYCDIF